MQIIFEIFACEYKNSFIEFLRHKYQFKLRLLFGVLKFWKNQNSILSRNNYKINTNTIIVTWRLSSSINSVPSWWSYSFISMSMIIIWKISLVCEYYDSHSNFFVYDIIPAIRCLGNLFYTRVYYSFSVYLLFFTDKVLDFRFSSFLFQVSRFKLWKWVVILNFEYCSCIYSFFPTFVQWSYYVNYNLLKMLRGSTICILFISSFASVRICRKKKQIIYRISFISDCYLLNTETITQNFSEMSLLSTWESDHQLQHQQHQKLNYYLHQLLLRSL